MSYDLLNCKHCGLPVNEGGSTSDYHGACIEAVKREVLRKSLEMPGPMNRAQRRRLEHLAKRYGISRVSGSEGERSEVPAQQDGTPETRGGVAETPHNPLPPSPTEP